MTFARIAELLDLEQSLRRRELYESGMAMAAAFNDPSVLEQFLPKIDKVVDWDQLPAMLRPVRKQPSNGT